MEKWNKLSIVFLNVLITLSLLLYTHINLKNYNDNWPVIISIISIVSLLIQLLSQRKLGFGIYDFVTYFFIFSHVFMFGNIYLLAIDKAEFISWGLIHRYHDELLFESALFILCYLQVLNLGILAFAKERINVNVQTHKFELKDKAVKNIGIVLAIISFPFRLIIDVGNIIAAQSNGSYYALESQSGISDDIAILFVPSMIFILNSSISKKKKTVLLIAFILYSTLNMILTGDRRYQFIGILIVIINYFYVNKTKIKVSRVIVLCILGVVGLNILTQISQIRQNSLVSITQFFSGGFTSFFSLDFIFEVFGEFGLSFMTVVIAMENIPKLIPFQYGFSFWGAIPSILPIGWIFPDFFYDVSIFRRLYEIEGYPVGASLPGELYANFGWHGLFITFVLGSFIGKYFKFSKMNNPLKTAQYFSVFYILINIVRASFLEITRNLFLIIIIPFMVFYFLKSMREKSD
ncbi:O-antigen polysaccharide polymerase Wzy [Paraliobacillus salinarum]|uniref:O-antigen polysaccharide polymerase Wzy n=1 Tax=Paraliobacillus salinarum TaxID=1158996 RepID=UPI0015F6989F|nr:O-antigen polysaccharide polymerase Wzy [Paraliobacillus salinarum]